MMASGRATSSVPIATSAYPAGMSSNLGQQGPGFPATGTAFRPQQQQPQAQQQDVNTPQFLQLVSSLMGNTNNNSSNGNSGNSSAGGFMSLGSNDLLSMAQRMGIFQQQQQQQQQQLEPVAGDINPVAWDPAQGGDFEENLSAGEQLDNENRFRHYQADQWTTMLEELIQFKRVNGHCNVPHTSKTLPALGRWVKRQRYQYKLMQEGKRESTMTPERAQVLEQVGFVWDAHSSTWVRRYQELQAYYEENGHTNVPSNYPRNPQLSTWCKFQRRQYKNLQRGGNGAGGGREPTGNSLTPARIQALEDIGFQWQLRRNRTRNTSTNV